ncbi:hypothetical protein PV326_011670 [Microctonus aethiopoides]|nr:hypothetical protein PV326_011670 [Microctonus aethiopoides]
MRLSIFNENDKVLLLGEGNFSFSVSLLKHNLKIILISTCYEPVPISETAHENIKYLKNHGVCVLLGVDATKLPEHYQLNNLRFNKILFNFPHVCSKMRLDKNRELLRNFFISAEKLLEAKGQVLVSLCNGQGGTNMDKPQRKWDDSWKIKEMAAHGNFILTAVEPYVSNNFSNYTRTGYRGLDKQFNINEALVHIFINFGEPAITHFIPTSIVDEFAFNLSNPQWQDIIPLENKMFGPPIFQFDITFSVQSDFKTHILFIILYNNAGNIINNVEFLRSYQFPDSLKITRTYRISYHSDAIPLYRKRIIDIHQNIISHILEVNLNMQFLRQLSVFTLKNVMHKQSICNTITVLKKQKGIISYSYRRFHCSRCLYNEDSTATPLRRKKPRSASTADQYFVDMKQVKTIGGNGGDGAISFLRLYMNDRAGPDGGDGGHGGHVIFEVSSDVKDLVHFKPLINADHGEKGYNKDCHGKNANHTVIKVPIGTIVRNSNGDILADMDEEGMMFIAARGGAGGHGNAFFASDTQQAPKIAEIGAVGEENQYVLEIRSMAHVGLIGLPNAGKSTLLRAISRARPKVAPYPFTTVRPHLGMVLYDDYEQIAVADLPGLIEDSHKNRGLGIMFLKHAERCAALLFIIDLSSNAPWEQLETLKYEIEQFSTHLSQRPQLIIANKIDLPGAEENLNLLKQHVDAPIIPISAKMGTNVAVLLKQIRILYDKEVKLKKNETPIEDSM